MYTKCKPCNYKGVIMLYSILLREANVGREAYIYLHYVIEHYSSLADVTIFTQADQFWSPHAIHDFRSKADSFCKTAAIAPFRTEQDGFGFMLPGIHYCNNVSY